VATLTLLAHSGVVGCLLLERGRRDADAGVGEQGEGGQHGVVQQPGRLAPLCLDLAGLTFRPVRATDARDAPRRLGHACADPDSRDRREDPAEGDGARGFERGA
jgi:hypothetical protein